jgi:catechol 2,3-dioxygenase-like lactoylglutathione lyase family enzyme
MAALALDHVNIRTARLAESIGFYGEVLGLSIVPPPMSDDFSRGAYACDATGRPVVHLVSTERFIPGNGAVRGAAQPGMIDHFALRCDGSPEAYAERLDTAGLHYDRADVAPIGMHLMFIRDPNGIMVELSFPLAG